jgi:hypothetical protein
MAAIAEVLYKLGHRGVDHSDELTLTVTEHGDRFGEWLAQSSTVKPVLFIVAHLTGTTLEAVADENEVEQCQSAQSVVLGLDPSPVTTQVLVTESTA